jgi:prolyl-tRNA editing enzyme YbaK/EbsC (Cys-tRNA(Pro) deacylase)
MAVQLTSADLQQYIDRNGIAARLIVGIGHTPTVPAAAAALGVRPEQIIKTLLFLVERPGPGGSPPQEVAPLPPEPVVVISNGESRVEKKVLAQHFGVGSKRVRLAPPEVVLEVLGYPAGGVPPFGHRTPVRVIVDAAVTLLEKGAAAVIYGGGGDDSTMMELTVAELLRLHKPEVVAVS